MLNLIIIIIIVVVVVVVVVVITKKKNVVQPMSSKVLKPEPDRMVRPGKPQTAHFCGSFRLKNRSMGKKQGPVRIAVRPHGFENRDRTASYSSLLPFESEP